MHKKTRFGQQLASGNSQAVFEVQTTGNDVHVSILKQALRSGKLNLSNRGLVTVPDKVWNLHELCNDERKNSCWDDKSDDKWWEQVELTALDLSSNRLIQLSTHMQNFGCLQTLNLQDNQLSCLPNEIGTIEPLRQLNLSHNNLCEVPKGIFNLKNLRVLSLKNNKLTELSEEFGNLNLLESLDLSGNQLTRLPNAMAFLSRVTNFNVSSNLLANLPEEIGSMLALRSLDVSSNKVKEMSTLHQLSHLQMLYLNHNEITQIPILTASQDLKELHAANNYLTELNEDVLEPILKLQILDLRDNHINKLSDFIVNLQNLERLDLSNNDLNSLPPQLGSLVHLKSLSLEGNPLKSIRRDVLQRGTVHIMKFLRQRSTESAGSDSTSGPIKDQQNSSNLPQIDVFSLRKSRTLDCSNCKSADIPANYFELALEAEVTVINLSRNQLTEFPQKMEVALPKVQELQLAGNKLSSVPLTIQSAKYLKFLDLSCNRLEALPEVLSTLTDLREIWLNGNKFSQLPPCLYRLKQLEIILASDNSIQVIDVDGLSQLTRLANLNLQNNNIQSVPPELGNLTQLRSLQLEGNPFRQPRTAVLAKGTNALLEYLRDRIPK